MYTLHRIFKPILTVFCFLISGLTWFDVIVSFFIATIKKAAALQKQSTFYWLTLCIVCDLTNGSDHR